LNTRHLEQTNVWGFKLWAQGKLHGQSRDFLEQLKMSLRKSSFFQRMNHVLNKSIGLKQNIVFFITLQIYLTTSYVFQLVGFL
jgi:hypothetical protein